MQIARNRTGRVPLFPLFFKMMAPRVSRFLTASQGERTLWEQDWCRPNLGLSRFVFIYSLASALHTAGAREI